MKAIWQRPRIQCKVAPGNPAAPHIWVLLLPNLAALQDSRRVRGGREEKGELNSSTFQLPSAI